MAVRIDEKRFGEQLAQFIGDEAPRRERWVTVGRVLAGELNALHARIDELRSETAAAGQLSSLAVRVDELERWLRTHDAELAQRRPTTHPDEPQ